MVLRTLSTMGPLHGYGIARRIEQVSGDRVILNQGTIYTSLVCLEQRGWIRSKWGVSENNCRARFYGITRVGEKQLVAETENWERLAAVMGRVLAAGGRDQCSPGCALSAREPGRPSGAIVVTVSSMESLRSISNCSSTKDAEPGFRTPTSVARHWAGSAGPTRCANCTANNESY